MLGAAADEVVDEVAGGDPGRVSTTAGALFSGVVVTPAVVVVV
jgi:hypothetical protein